MKRYLLFIIEEYYPSGGWNDLEAGFDTLEEVKQAVEQLEPCHHQWYDIVDTEKGETGEIITGL